jgi:hypothetical protein
MSNFFHDIGQATNKLLRTLGQEPGRAMNEAGRHVTESIESVTKATKDGGVFGALFAAADKFSPGNVVAGLVDAVIPGRDLPQPLADGISAAANGLLSASPAGLPLALLSLVDGFQALGGLLSGGRESAQRMQTPERPSDAASRGAPFVEGRIVVRGGGLSGEGRLGDLTWVRPGAGFGTDVRGIDGRGLGIDDGARAGRARLARLERDLDRADAEIDRILRNPHLSFEDMVFLLMRAIIKQSQAEVKIGLQSEKNGRDAARRAERTERQSIQAEEAAIGRERAALAMRGGQGVDGAMARLAERQTAVNARRETFGAAVGEASESRQERFEELKQAMQKISEMQQALSNILNSLHQTAMNTIGNIR